MQMTLGFYFKNDLLDFVFKVMHSNGDYGTRELPSAMSDDSYEYGKSTKDSIEETNFINPNSCWNRFKNGIRSLWATRHTEDTKVDRQLYIKTTLRELVIYIFFLAVLVIISFGMTTVQAYWFTNLLSGLFTTSNFNDNSGTFAASTTESDFWKFLTGPLLNGLYWTTWYNNINFTSDQINFLYYENRLIGLPRLRQVRVRNDSCSIPSDFQGEIKQCFAAYSMSSESKDSYGQQNSTPWVYTNSSVLDTTEYQGIVATYGGGGFYVNLNSTQVDSYNTIMTLFNNLWIDRGTRAVIIDFTVYNANINLFCYIKLVGEFPPTGGLLVSSQFRTVKLIRYVGSIDFFVLACELLFVVFIVYYIVEESLEIKMLKFEYFFSIWNILDILVIIFSLTCSIFNIVRTLTVQNIIQTLVANDNIHPNFESLTFWQLQFDNLIAITLFLAWVKVFKYISFNKTMTQLSATLSRCSKDLAGFAIMFFIIFIAFAQLGYLIFGAQVNDFSKLQYCIYTLFRIILGDFDFAQLEVAHRIFGPLYFVFYVFFVFFVLFNMFLAIITDTYGEVKEELANQKNEFEIADYVKERTEVVLAKLHLKKDKIIDIQNAVIAGDTNNDGKMDFDEWKVELKSRGYGDAEIEAVFARYDTDGDKALDEAEQIAMQKELEDQKNSLDLEIQYEKSEILNKTRDVILPVVSLEEYRALNRRVDRMDNNTRIIVTKIDTVLEALESIEKDKARSRETMGIILNTLNSNDDNEDYDIDDDNDEIKKKKIKELIANEIHKLNQNSVSTFQRH
uniref:PKD2-4 n=1 Tax=Schmidtea mediterranea TaxID=79327 RepID=A0A0H3YFG1_SCHMD|nr:PKD2-4 [Schmidtea mediterranea]